MTRMLILILTKPLQGLKGLGSAQALTIVENELR